MVIKLIEIVITKRYTVNIIWLSRFACGACGNILGTLLTSKQRSLSENYITNLQVIWYPLYGSNIETGMSKKRASPLYVASISSLYWQFLDTNKFDEIE